MNIPLAIACLVLGALVLPKHAPAAEGAAARLHIDLPGILLFTVTLMSLLLFLMDMHLHLLWLLGISAVAAAGFTWWERRSADPFIEVRVFASNGPLMVTYARAVVAAIVSYSFLYGVTQWLEDGRRLSASVTGLVLLPTFAVGIVVSTVTGRRPEIRAKLVVGAVAQLIACALLLFATADAAMWFLVVIAIAFGIPQGLVNLAIQNTLYHQADPARIGASAGLLRTFMYLGAMLASSASGALYGTTASTPGLHELAVFMLVAAGILLVITIGDRSLAWAVPTGGTHDAKEPGQS